MMNGDPTKPNQDRYIGSAPHPLYRLSLGAYYLGDGKCRFRVWAPQAQQVEVELVEPDTRRIPMARQDRGYFELTTDGVAPGSLYFYRLDGSQRPDPASHSQPQGVHRASQVIDHHFQWDDGRWCGLPLKDYITYELHTGTFTREGTFEAIIAYLDELKDLGITAVELMPISQFPGNRNWGYDGVHAFAAQNTYGGPAGLKRLVNACHQRGLAVVLDVVYNHIGPEGNYLGEFGHYFTNRYNTPWGQAINFDGPHSDEVRRYFIENALYWIELFHIDALRLDAVHAIYDFSAQPFLQELADAVRLQGQRLNRQVFTIAESSLNDVRLILPKQLGGYGIDAQWSDDLHHALRTLLTGDRSGYYEDFDGFNDLVTAYRQGFVFDGRYSPFRARRHGNSARQVPPVQHVVCAQNHDQIGNRLLGERLTELLSFEQLKLAAGVVLLSPYQPMLFMGEEYAETAPFQYFVSHTDPDLVEAVRRGRKEEFAGFQWQQEPPDPQDEGTFARCRLNHDLKNQGHHRVLRDFYKSLIDLRKSDPALALGTRENMETLVLQNKQVMAARRWTNYQEVCVVFHFGAAATTVSAPLSPGSWTKRLDSSDPRWQGPGTVLPDRLESSGEVALSLAPQSLVAFTKESPV